MDPKNANEHSICENIQNTHVILTYKNSRLRVVPFMENCNKLNIMKLQLFYQTSMCFEGYILHIESSFPMDLCKYFDKSRLLVIHFHSTGEVWIVKILIENCYAHQYRWQSNHDCDGPFTIFTFTSFKCT